MLRYPKYTSLKPNLYIIYTELKDSGFVHWIQIFPAVSRPHVPAGAKEYM